MGYSSNMMRRKIDREGWIMTRSLDPVINRGWFFNGTVIYKGWSPHRWSFASKWHETVPVIFHGTFFMMMKQWSKTCHFGGIFRASHVEKPDLMTGFDDRRMDPALGSFWSNPMTAARLKSKALGRFDHSRNSGVLRVFHRVFASHLFQVSVSRVFA